MLADDDDIYLPWHIEQAVDGIKINGKDAWRPAASMFASPERIEMCQNTLEASVIVKMVSYRDWETDRKSTRLNSSHSAKSRMPSSA